MAVQLKQLKDQVLVLTGASSGIGLVTARAAARRGARLVLAARNGEALQQLVNEIHEQGGEAISVAADITEEDDVERIAATAKARFGGFDTWVNNAGVSIYGECTKVSIEDMRHLFETNFWGVVHGSRVAARHLRQRGGALINIGSTLSDRAVPLQGIYCASKHAVKGWTDALRMELENDGAPVSVTLIKPAAIDTPYPLHAKNYLEDEPEHPAPVYAPEVVAEAILHCAEVPERDLFAGGGGALMAGFGALAPGLTDKFMEKSVISQTHSGRPARGRDDNAFNKPGQGLQERGDYSGHVSESSLYTKASMHPLLAGLAALGGIGIAAAVAKQVQKR